MVVRGDRLFARICADCESDGRRDFVIDLCSFTLKRLDSGTRQPGAGPTRNPPIPDIVKEVFRE